MKFLKASFFLKVISNLYFAIFLLILIALSSSIGSFLEQDEPLEFYQENYSLSKPIYGFISWPWITFLGLDHVYKTWWFFGLLFLLGSSLFLCTITRQFPLFLTSKDVFFKKEKKSFLSLPFFRKVKNLSYIRENLLLKIQTMNFCIYQKGNFLYGYKGLIGRISPILVHFSLLLILFGSSIGAVKNFKAQEILPKGEIFHIQNPISAGWLTDLPNFNLRVNDFWVEYQNKKIHQFYSNLSILDNYGNELKEQTISVNNPLRYKQIDFYQSDWNLVGIRIKRMQSQQIYEIPLFSFQKDSKSWITWIQLSQFQNGEESKNSQTKPVDSQKKKNNLEQTYSMVFDHFQNTFLLYDSQGNFLGIKNIGEVIENEFCVMDVIPSTGLLVKYDPSIPLIYFGFGLLMVTSSLSFFPYTQLWLFHQSENSWLGGSTNRGKIQFEIEFENLVRLSENLVVKSDFTFFD
jgi:cytochrome c biogenesis protein